MFNYRLDILLFLLSIILPLNIFYRATVEVIGSILLKDDISLLTLGNTDFRGEMSNFCLDLRSLDPISSSF
jgi:hypothetical protein